MSGAAFFDLDKTIIAKSSTLAFGRPFYQGGLINRRAVLKSTYAQLVYLSAGADEDQLGKMRDYLADLCAGWDIEQVRQIVTETLHDLIDPLVYAEAAALIADHQAAGRDVIIVSSSGEEVVGPIGELVGADHVIATRMVVDDGRYTGEIDFYAYGPHKATAMRELAAQLGYDLDASYAYSDSATDLPMLEVVGHPHVVNPDRALRREALRRGWPVMEFRRPVSTRRGLARPAAPAVGTAVIVFTLAAALYAARRRRRRTGLAPHGDFPSARQRRTKASGARRSRWAMTHRPEGTARKQGTHARPAAGGASRQARPGPTRKVHAW